MTPAQQAKAAGLKNLTQVSKSVRKSLNTLTNWHRDAPELFKIVLLGCMASLKRTGAENKKEAKLFIDANVWDGEDRSGAKSDKATFDPDDLQELIDDLIDHLGA